MPKSVAKKFIKLIYALQELGLDEYAETVSRMNPGEALTATSEKKLRKLVGGSIKKTQWAKIKSLRKWLRVAIEENQPIKDD